MHLGWVRILPPYPQITKPKLLLLFLSPPTAHPDPLNFYTMFHLSHLCLRVCAYLCVSTPELVNMGDIRVWPCHTSPGDPSCGHENRSKDALVTEGGAGPELTVNVADYCSVSLSNGWLAHHRREWWGGDGAAPTPHSTNQHQIYICLAESVTRSLRAKSRINRTGASQIKKRSGAGWGGVGERAGLTPFAQKPEVGWTAPSMS